jgi:hypothetical protein
LESVVKGKHSRIEELEEIRDTSQQQHEEKVMWKCLIYFL